MYAGEKVLELTDSSLFHMNFYYFNSIPILISFYIEIAALSHKSYNGISSLFKLNGKGYTARLFKCSLGFLGWDLTIMAYFP